MAFWGLVLEPKKSYTQREVEHPFHISMAALDLQNCDSNEQAVSVVCRRGDSDFLLCSLSKKHNIFNVPLNLEFELGGEINFMVLGNSTVHLTGYMMEDEGSYEESDDSLGEEEEESDVSRAVLLKNTKKLLDAVNKRKPDGNAQNKAKKVKLEEVEEEEEEDDSDFDMDSDSELGEEEEEDDEDAEEEEEEEESPTKAGAIKKEKPKQAGKQNAPGKASQNVNQGKKDAAKSQGQAQKTSNGTQPQTNGVPKKQQLKGGVQVEELAAGNGPVAKDGKIVTVYYVGRLKNNNKQFDATQSGPGFKFRLGRGEVIPGWDIGVAGMKVGGKRRLTIPPKMGYGPKGSGSVIPPNSTLVFEVELRNVK